MALLLLALLSVLVWIASALFRHPKPRIFDRAPVFGANPALGAGYLPAGPSYLPESGSKPRHAISCSIGALARPPLACRPVRSTH
jgi:hypothetical protein